MVLDGIASRNSRRAANLHVSDDGLNYSWDWDSVHFINMNIWPGLDIYDIDGDGLLYNFTFLKNDLADNVGTSDRPIIIYFHYPLDGGTFCLFNGDRQTDFANVIAGYNVIGIFHGHRHLSNAYSSDWTVTIINDEGIEETTTYVNDVFEHAAAAIEGERFMVVRLSGAAKTMHVFTRTRTSTETKIDWDSLLLTKPISFGNPTFRVLDTNDAVVDSYPTLQYAYDAASDGYTIQSQAVVSTENLTLDQNKSITLKSGYDSDFTTFTGETTILGNVDITAGSITIDEGSLTITN